MAFPTIDEVQEMLEAACEEIPEAFYDELNLGIHLEPEPLLHPEGHGDLYILGQYSVNLIGCQISIFYGSFKVVFADADRDEVSRQVKETLLHEFLHHMERRAGERDLEIEDEEELASYHHEYALRAGGQDASG